jgi:UDP-N-acetylmuramoyl-tripeptide--D-alanyl-D-alanine ligase
LLLNQDLSLRPSQSPSPKGKGELFDYLKSAKGTLFIYNDYDYLQNMSAGSNSIIRYGNENEQSDIVGHIINDQHLLEVKVTKGASIEKIKTQLVGGYNLPNVLAAVCIGKTFNVVEEKIKVALENYCPSNSRSQLLIKDGNTIILDAYNANPSSMKEAIINFAKMEGEHKILFLGGMMELGVESEDEHKNLIELIQKYDWKNVVLVGKQFQEIHQNYLYFPEVLSAKDWFKTSTISNAQILIKGSRSMQMEKILD